MHSIVCVEKLTYGCVMLESGNITLDFGSFWWVGVQYKKIFCAYALNKQDFRIYAFMGGAGFRVHFGKFLKLRIYKLLPLDPQHLRHDSLKYK